jgi:hypothetical protein
MDFESVFHSYGDPPAEIIAKFGTGARIMVYLGREGRVHAVAKNPHGHVIATKGQAKALALPKVGILPQIRPLVPSEIVLDPEYVRQSLSSTLASRHFRNELNLLYDDAFAEFKDISEATWHGLEIQELGGKGRDRGAELKLMLRNEEFVGEVNLMGHGLQMWLQTMWFLARCGEYETVILDEPDVYMHADLQRRLIRFLKGRYPQVILATHSVEIMSEVEPDNILVVDREKRQAQFTTDVPEVQKVVDQIGGVQNLQLARLWGAKRCLLVEGDDLNLLKYFQNILFPNSAEPIDVLPNLSLGGWGGWNYAIGSSMAMNTAIGQNVRSYCIFDSDFHTPSQIATRKAEARKKGVSLHVWSRKEIENYLLVPAAIRRLMERRIRDRGPVPTNDVIADKLFQLAGEFEIKVFDAFVAEFHSEDRHGGPAQANRAARERIYPKWNTTEGRLALAPGKEVLSKVAQWLQADYGVSMSPVVIAREIRRNEIPDEIVQVLTSIENGDPF